MSTAHGDQVNLYVNSALSDVYREAEPEIARDGLIAVQIQGGPMEVKFKDIQILVLP